MIWNDEFKNNWMKGKDKKGWIKTWMIRYEMMNSRIIELKGFKRMDQKINEKI